MIKKGISIKMRRGMAYRTNQEAHGDATGSRIDGDTCGSSEGKRNVSPDKMAESRRSGLRTQTSKFI